MNKKIEITLPPVNVNKEEQDIKIRQMLTYDKNEKEGTLSQVMVFAQMYGPLSITNLTNKMELYFRKEIERANVSRAVDKLVKLGLMMRVTSGDVLFMPEDEKVGLLRVFESLSKLSELKKLRKASSSESPNGSST